MANATFFLFFVAHNAAGSQGVNERTKRGKKKNNYPGPRDGNVYLEFFSTSEKEREILV